MKLKNARWAGLIALMVLPLISVRAQPTGAPPAETATSPVALSPAAAEVVNLADSGSSDEVLIAYVQKATAAYNLSADDVVYLKDVGLSSDVITAMLNHDKTVPAQTYTYNQQAFPPNGQSPAPPPAPAQPVAPPPAESAPPAYDTSAPADVNYFYNDLSPYGTWVSLEGYGWCWQPRTVVINRGWRPYCDGGHWVYSDAGWFWASDYSWGWAPFHYGRWHMHPSHGWVWFPDRVWGPAWVVWRSSGDNCGWAPLPFRATFDERLGFRYNGVSVRADFDFGLSVGLFTFVGLHDFNSHDLGHRRLPPTEVTRIYKNTTIINNYTVVNHRVVNHGIPVERVSVATHTTIRPVTVRDVPAGSPRPTTRGGNPAVVYRHELKMPARTTTPVVAQKVNELHPVIHHEPIAPARIERRTTPGAVTPAPTYTPGRQQRDIQTPPQQPSGEKFTPRNRNQYSPGDSRSGATVPAAPRAEETKQPDSSSKRTLHYSTPHDSNVKPAAPLQTATPTEQNPHVYHPKGYYQANSAHALPPEQPVTRALLPRNPTSSSQPSGRSPGQSKQSDKSDNSGKK